MNKPYGIIYKITNITNNYCYIGQTKRSLNKRWIEHLRNSSKNFNNYLHNAIKKYRPENFKIDQICECHSLESLNEMEKFYILKFDTFWKNGHGYNLTFGGNGTIGYKHTEETKNKMSVLATGRIFSEETKNKFKEIRSGSQNGMYGKHHSEETKSKMRKKRTPEGCKNIQRAKKLYYQMKKIN